MTYLPDSNKVSQRSSNYGQIRQRTVELAALRCLKKKKIFSDDNTLGPKFFNGSSSLFLAITSTTIESQMSSNFDQSPPLIME